MSVEQVGKAFESTPSEPANASVYRPRSAAATRLWQRVRMALHETECGAACAGEHVQFVGGPLDGWLMPSDRLDAEQRTTGVAHIIPWEGGRACYSAPAGDPFADRWGFEGVNG